MWDEKGLNWTVETDAVKLLAGGYEIEDIPMEPFSDEVLDFLDTLSKEIRNLSRKEAKEELKALGFWLRRAHLLDLKKRHGRSGCLGLGKSFHIASGNVPFMFAYTCAIGLLAGNSCRVRVSGRRTEEAKWLCRQIDKILREERFFNMRHRISILTYDREAKWLTEVFSKECDARIVWGGDQTIEEIRKIPLKPSASELVFPDRSSIAILSAKEVLKLSKEELGELARRFYNDTYAMDQNACSCPRLVLWQEETKEIGREASSLFWNAVANVSECYHLSEIKVSQKYGALWECAGIFYQIKQIRHWKNRLYVLEMECLEEMISEVPMQFGIFLEYHLNDHEEWRMAISEKTQTLTFFGILPESLQKTVLFYRLRGVSQIIPVGQALQMELFWDGKDLIGELSRMIGLWG